MDQLIQQRVKGIWTSSSQLLASELFDANLVSREMSGEDRLEFLKNRVAWAKRFGPPLPVEVLNTELRVAEALDEIGRSGEASNLLDDLQVRAEGVDNCKLADVVRAKAGFCLSHQRSHAAVTGIEDTIFAKEAKEGTGPLGIDYA